MAARRAAASLVAAVVALSLGALACGGSAPATPSPQAPPVLTPGPQGGFTPSGDGTFVTLEVVEGSTRIEGDDLYKFLIITGEVINHTDTWVKAPQVYVLIYDAGGNLIREEDEFFATIGRIPPGGRSPFRYTRDLSKIEGEPAGHTIESFAIPTDDSQQAVIEKLQTNPSGGDVEISGDFKSTGTADCHFPLVVVTLRKDGKVAEVDSYVVDTGESLDLPPGQSVPFNETLYDAAGYEVQVDAACR